MSVNHKGVEIEDGEPHSPANRLAVGNEVGALADNGADVWVLGNHYTCLPYLPSILVDMKAIIHGSSEAGD